MKKVLLVGLAVIMMMSFMVVPAEARRHHRDNGTDVYLEDPRTEAGVGVDLVHPFNENHEVKWENRFDLNNNDISGNFDDWTSKGLSTYIVYEFRK